MSGDLDEAAAAPVAAAAAAAAAPAEAAPAAAAATVIPGADSLIGDLLSLDIGTPAPPPIPADTVTSGAVLDFLGGGESIPVDIVRLLFQWTTISNDDDDVKFPRINFRRLGQSAGWSTGSVAGSCRRRRSCSCRRRRGPDGRFERSLRPRFTRPRGLRPGQSLLARRRQGERTGNLGIILPETRTGWYGGFAKIYACK